MDLDKQVLHDGEAVLRRFSYLRPLLRGRMRGLLPCAAKNSARIYDFYPFCPRNVR